MTKITENDIELYTIEELKRLGFQFLHGTDISPDGEFPERQAYSDVILKDRLRTALQRLNPAIPADAGEQALRDIQRINSPELLANNEVFHRFLTDGVPVQYRLDSNVTSMSGALTKRHENEIILRQAQDDSQMV